MEALPISGLIGDKALVAVVEISDASAAAELARCLARAGVPAIEITLRTPTAIASLEAATGVEGICVGAGTVFSPDQAEQCKDAGARFAVSPVFDDDVAARCQDIGLPFVPGAVTPTEVRRAVDAGYGELKVFPAESFGGLSLVRSLAAIFPAAKFMPTGGVDQERAVAYFSHPAVSAVGGTWIAPADLIRDRNWNKIEQRALAAMQALGRSRADEPR